MEKKYDLTTEKGLQSAMQVLQLANPPIFWVIKLVRDILFSSEKLEKQKEIAESLIHKGKAEGARKMVIVMDNFRGGKLNIPLEEAKVDTMIGADEKLIVKVRYK